MANKPALLIRYTLGCILLVLALNAFAGGYYGMAGAKGIPASWLQGSLFKNYFIPGLFLFLVVGGITFFAAYCIFFRKPMGIKAAYVSGIILLGWIGIQVAIIGYVSWMQPAVAALALLILLFSWLLQRTEPSA